MSYEMRVGLLAVITIAVTIWGYTFMKGKNLLRASNIYYVEYHNINELTATSPVFIRGLRVGTVSEVRLTPDMTGVIATLDIERGIKIHEETVALVVSTSIMGGRGVVLKIPSPCDGNTCAESGDYLEGRVQGLFESLVGDAEFDEFVDKMRAGINDIFGGVQDSLAGPETLSAVAQSFRDIQAILSNLEGITRQLNESMPVYENEILASLGNVEEFTGVLAEKRGEIAATLDNLEQITTDLKEAQLGDKSEQLLASSEEAIAAVEQTLTNADNTLAELKSLINNIGDGDGTIGRLMKDDSLYTNLNNTARNLELLLQDFRLNPKRYVNVSVFGKKQKEYEVPESDPAFNQGEDSENDEND